MLISLEVEHNVRYFLHTYSRQDNFVISQEADVFGAPKGNAGLTRKFLKLRLGDLIIIRDGRRKQSLSFFGYCRVVGEVFDHDEYSPFTDLLWRDEQAKRKVIYPLRVAVDFLQVPKLHLEYLTWDTLDGLDFVNKQGARMVGKQAWGKKLSGNFVQEPAEVEAFSRLVGFNEHQFCALRA